ncbi:hypothetical protein GCM10010185_44170 [Saccharothrix coeruleofusca]|uniref:Uncharacterized protein n=1 Tax=Saccharothrix coeruleofusca TaxID=33919 RepID=A0A918EEL9_9PSEU|nr:hypothetical protein GCM10010185_44170 [Saccharothrix coeruleofusca]
MAIRVPSAVIPYARTPGAWAQPLPVPATTTAAVVDTTAVTAAIAFLVAALIGSSPWGVGGLGGVRRCQEASRRVWTPIGRGLDYALQRLVGLRWGQQIGG